MKVTLSGPTPSIAAKDDEILLPVEGAKDGITHLHVSVSYVRLGGWTASGYKLVCYPIEVRPDGIRICVLFSGKSQMLEEASRKSAKRLSWLLAVARAQVEQRVGAAWQLAAAVCAERGLKLVQG
jgi:hypothetical protein